MRRFDDTLWSIYRISKGKTKVIIAPHDIHALRADSHVPCDAYCKKVGDSWLDFYSTEESKSRNREPIYFKANREMYSAKPIQAEIELDVSPLYLEEFQRCTLGSTQRCHSGKKIDP